MKFGHGPLRIGPLRCEQRQRLFHVSAKVDRHVLWFESPTELAAAPEAFAGIFWIPALALGRRLVMEDDLDSQWLANAQHTVPVAHRWWGYPETAPLAAASTSPVAVEAVAAPAGDTGACFTCGVDSFHMLLSAGDSIRTLVFAHGYDIPCDDWPRRRALERSLRAVAEATGKHLALVRTNLRSHPTFARLSWGQTHGAALAALGHLLSGSLGRLLIPSSYPYRFARPWGSSWELDPHWSSRRVQIVHGDASLIRKEKVEAICAHPLVQRHLQVCWSLKRPAGNCGACEKCLRTMVMCQAAGHLEAFEVFPGSCPLHQRLDGCPSFPAHLRDDWLDLAQLPLPTPTLDAIHRLLARSAQVKRSRSSAWRFPFGLSVRRSA